MHANEGDASTSYLPAIIGSATDNCQGPCDDIVGVIQQCTDASPADDDLEVARCACSISTLGVISEWGFGSVQWRAGWARADPVLIA